MNKAIRLCMILVLFLYINGQAQEKIDTIYVSNGTTSIIAPGPIKIHVIGTPGHFAGKVVDKYLLLRSTSKNLNVNNTILISYYDTNNQLKEKFFHLKYTPKACKENYYLEETEQTEIKRESSQVNNSLDQTRKENDPTNEGNNIRLKNKTFSLLDMEDDVSTLGIKKNYLSVFVKMIRVDEKHLFLKMQIVNESALDYNLDLISFQYVRKYERGFLKKKEEKPRDVFAIVKPEISKIDGFSSEYLCYAIPLYAMRNNENFRIILRESNGNRNIELDISPKEIAKTKRI